MGKQVIVEKRHRKLLNPACIEAIEKTDTVLSFLKEVYISLIGTQKNVEQYGNKAPPALIELGEQDEKLLQAYLEKIGHNEQLLIEEMKPVDQDTDIREHIAQILNK